MKMRYNIKEAADQSFKFHKTFTQDQIDQLASISPKTDLKNKRWGDYSLWVLSKANQLVKNNKRTFEQIIQNKDYITKDLEAFSQYKKEIGTNNIDTFKTFGQLHDAVAKFINNNGEIIKKTTTSQMSNRARSAYSKMKQPKMKIVYEDQDWLVSSPNDIETNKTMAPIGKWCHTGNGADADKYWNEYHVYGPLYYILNKKDGYCLCMSYSRQKEIRNQFDFQPQRVELGSPIWRLDVDNIKVKRDSVLEYRNTEKEWNEFFDFIDPTENVKSAILNFENQYDENLQHEYEKQYEQIINKSIQNDVLIVSNDNYIEIKKLLTPEYVPEPDEDDFQSEEEYEEQAEIIDEYNSQKKDEYDKILAKIAKNIFSKIKVIKLSEYRQEWKLFNQIDYPGQLPAIDVGQLKDISKMFMNFNLSTAPQLINTDNIENATDLFLAAKKIEQIDNITFKNCIKADQMLRIKNLKKIGKIILPKCESATTLFGYGQINQTLQIDQLYLPNVKNIFDVFSELNFKNIKINNITIPNAIDLDMITYIPINSTNNKSSLGKYILDHVKKDILKKINIDDDNWIRISDYKDYVNNIQFFKIYNSEINGFDFTSFQNITNNKDSFTYYNHGHSLNFTFKEQIYSVLNDLMHQIRNWNIKITKYQYDNFPQPILYSILQIIKNNSSQGIKNNIFILENGKYLLKTMSELYSKSETSQKDKRILKLTDKDDSVSIKNQIKNNKLFLNYDIIDITQLRMNSNRNLVLFINDFVPTDVDDIPILKITNDQYKYRDEYKIAYNHGDDYDIDYRTEVLFHNHLKLAKKYGSDGQKLSSMNKIIIDNSDLKESQIKIYNFNQFLKIKNNNELIKII